MSAQFAVSLLLYTAAAYSYIYFFPRFFWRLRIEFDVNKRGFRLRRDIFQCRGRE